MTTKQPKDTQRAGIPQREWYLHELVHGTMLTIRMFDAVCESGFGDDRRDAHIFRENPKAHELMRKAEAALNNFYQELGTIPAVKGRWVEGVK